MKKKQLFASVVLSTFALVSAFAQETTQANSFELSDEAHHFVATKTTFDKAPLHCMTDVTNKYIAYIFEEKNNAFVLKHRIEVYDMDSNEKLWQLSFSPLTTSYEMTNYGLLEKKNDSSIRLYDYSTGTRLWKVNAPVCCGVFEDKVFVSAISRNIWAHSLKDGKQLWKANLSFENGISTSYAIDPIHSFLAMDNLYKLNWEDGSYIKTDIKTAVTNKGALAGKIGGALLGAAVGVAIGGGGYFYYPIYTNSTITDRFTNAELVLPANDMLNSGLSSNIIEDNGKYYIADRKGIMSFDKDLNILWETKHADERASRSELTLVNGNLYLMNLGFGIKSGNAKKMGHAFVAGYKASDGTQLFFKELSDEKKMVLSVNIDEEKACMLFDDAMSSVYFADNNVNTIQCDTTRYGAFEGFVNANEEFICRDGQLQYIKDVIKTPAVYTTRGNVLEVSPTTGKLTELKSEGFYHIVGKCGKMTIIRGGEEDRELWCIEDGKATNLSNNADKVWVKNYLVSVITHAGTSILIHLDKTI